MGMSFAGPSIYRDRRAVSPSPYNPTRTVPGDWSGPLDTIELTGVYIDSTSTSAIPDAIRTETQIYKSLFADPDDEWDVQVGDRIRVGDDAYMVKQRPSSDINPFTGWQPVIEWPLTGVQG